MKSNFSFFQMKENRTEFKDIDLPEDFEDPPEEREIDLNLFASAWDLDLFREAQSLASEDLENSLRGMPDLRNTKYIEFGKWEMEVGIKINMR